MKRSLSRATDVAFALCAALFGLWVLNASGCSTLPLEVVPTGKKEIDLGAKALKGGKPKEAQKQFDLAIQKAPSNPILYAAVLNYCCNLNFPSMVEYGATVAERALAGTKQAGREDRAVLCDALGTYYVNLGGPAAKKGIQFYREARKLDPENHQYLNDLGYGLAETEGNDRAALEEALYLTQTAVELARQGGAPSSVMGLYVDSLGWVQYKLKDYDAALTNLYSAATLVTDRWEIHYHLAKAFEAKNRIPEAIESLRKASRLNETNADLRRALDDLSRRHGAATGAPNGKKGSENAPTVGPIPEDPSG